MSLKITKTGLQDTVQDLGRFGYQHLGINPGGAMDRFSASIANMLVGNRSGDALIEIQFPASQYLFQMPALISLCGADLGASIDGMSVPLYQPLIVGKGALLSFKKMNKGVRSYLAVYSGWDIPSWLGSYSTHIKAAAGGFKGRSLQINDTIEYSPFVQTDLLGKHLFKTLPWKAGPEWGDPAPGEIYALAGKELDDMTRDSADQFTSEPFIVSNQADRMGYLLDGPFLELNVREELVSSAVSFGTIQLLPIGSLMVLMADHQTTGGYPRIGHIITAHHSKMAQLRPGDNIRFKIVDMPTAENLFVKQQQHLLQLQNACTFKLQDWLHAYN
jgi:antagonist of KipI